ncbi:GNAT family N-acetyltransferase [Taibaiella lutea]|uniref:GNAT family N-acetyltransferase n=1 Tax=Taibaiella lutea TaxID=2608001 RepID=A0A5M6CAY2_9BACT|nr:GNAT family N-acetyltransferase [Taibaiella lutea]KAA5532151.1 GNAT family N-acetyltransferase [Taibaiella lutea]
MEIQQTDTLTLRKAHLSEKAIIWQILQDAIEQRKQEGSRQWQDGYPNELSIINDMEKGYAYVLTENETVLAYSAVIFDKEPAYEIMEGKWLSDGDYLVVHRVAVSRHAKGKGIATRLFRQLESLCLQKQVYSIKVDTNFDNIPMLKILDRLGYTYCGEVYFRGGARKAFEKVLTEQP